MNDNSKWSLETDLTMDFSESYSTRWRLMKVNPATWEDAGEVGGFVSGSISRNCTDDYPMLEAGNLTLDRDVGEGLDEGYYRIEAALRQGTSHLIPIATLFLMSANGTTQRRLTTLDVSGTSVLLGAKERIVMFGDYAPKGCDGAEYAASLLREVIQAPVVVDGSFTLDNHVVFGKGVEYIKAVWTVLDAANWCMRINGNGVVHIGPKPSEPSFYFDDENAKYITPGVPYTEDLTSIPNHYIAVDGTQREEAWNEDPDSRTSTVSRGRIVDYMDTNPIRINGETLYSYAQRQLEEISTIVKTMSYKREYIDGLLPFDMVEGSLREVDMAGRFRILSQNLSIGKGILVDEKIGKEVKEYEAQ